MQEHMDSWLEEDWEKTTQDFEKKKKQKETYKQSTKKSDAEEVSVKGSSTNEKSFTLQYYVDKIKYYSEHKKSSDSSHLQELEKMPVIGH